MNVSRIIQKRRNASTQTDMPMDMAAAYRAPSTDSHPLSSGSIRAFLHGSTVFFCRAMYGTCTSIATWTAMARTALQEALPTTTTLKRLVDDGVGTRPRRPPRGRDTDEYENSEFSPRQSEDSDLSPRWDDTNYDELDFNGE